MHATDSTSPAGEPRARRLPIPQGAADPSWRVIQGGMGVGISNWRLARAVSARGQLGVVSGTGLDTLFVRRLQDGDEGGHLRSAMETHPDQDLVRAVLRRWFRDGGRASESAYPLLPLDGRGADLERQRLIALASFVEVTLAKRGHSSPVGINLLTKIPMPNLASLYGAMLAGVDVVLMGAGIPREIPQALDQLAEGRPAQVRLEVAGMAADDWPWFRLDPAEIGGMPAEGLKRPLFLPIVSSNLLAQVMVKKATGRIDGLVIEGPHAGGHVAPPRGEARANERGEPVYGERDEVDVERIAALGLPFWLAGGMGRPEKLREVLARGATGVQVGTLFAFCEESGLAEPLRRQAIDLALRGELDVVTSARASSTGFPFKVVSMPGTLSDPAIAASRERRCDLGYLRMAYRTDSGGIGFRCPGESVATFVAKGGAPEDAEGRTCLCNALMASAGVPQALPGGAEEPPILTAGDDARDLSGFLAGRRAYSADDVLAYLLG